MKKVTLWDQLRCAGRHHVNVDVISLSRCRCSKARVLCRHFSSESDIWYWKTKITRNQQVRKEWRRLGHRWDQPRAALQLHFWKCGWSDILLCLTKDKIKSKQENEEQVENNPSLSYYQIIPCLLPRLLMCVLWEVMCPSSLLHQLHGNQGRGGSNSQAEMYFLALNSTS